MQTSRGVPEDALALTRDPRPLKGKVGRGFAALLRFTLSTVVLDGPVARVVKDGSGRVIPIPHGQLSPPSRSDEQIQWGKDGALRVLHHGVVRIPKSLTLEMTVDVLPSGRAYDRSYFSNLRCICGPRHSCDWIGRFLSAHLAPLSCASVNVSIRGLDNNQDPQGTGDLAIAPPSLAQT